MMNRDVTFNSNEMIETDKLDSYAKSALSTTPSYAHSALEEFTSGVLQVAALGADVESVFLGKRTPESIGIHETLNQMQIELANVKSIPQKTVNFTANMLGTLFSAVPLLAEQGGKSVGELVTFGISKILPKAAEKIAQKKIPSLTLEGIGQQSIGEFSRKSLISGTRFAGFMLPSELEQSYDEKTNKFNLNKAFIGVSANSALGALIPSAQFLAGVVGNRLKSLSSKVEKDIVTKGLERGHINKETHDFLKEYEQNPDSELMHKRATDILRKEGMPVDVATNRVYLKLLTEENTKNLESVVVDQFASEFGNDKTALSDFIIHGRLDELKGNQSMSAGIDGWLDYIEKHLNEKESSIQKVDSSLKLNEKLQSIKDKLIKDNKLVDDFKNKKSYKRLVNSSKKSKSARKLLDRIHLEDAYNAQDSYKSMLKSFNQIIQSNIVKLANPGRVSDYLKQRLSKSAKDQTFPRQSKEVFEQKESIPKDEELSTTLSEQQSIVDQSESQEIKEEYSISKERLEEFKKSESVLKSLISCVMGSNNVK